MKPTKPIVSITSLILFTCLLFAVLCGVARAQPTNLLGNPGFELPDIGKYTNFDAGGPTPFWNDDGVNYTNTGVENTGAHSGTYRAYEMVGDDGAYQISTNPVPLVAGQQIILTWWALGTTSSDPQGTNLTDPMQIVGIITATNYNNIIGNGNDLFTNTTPVLVVSNGLGNAWAQYSLTYTVQAADAGKYPGVFFFAGEVTNTPTAGVWLGYDDFALWVVPATSKPIILSEPASTTAPLGNSVSFTVSAVDATGYQWQGGAPGSGVYTNLLNAGQFAGVNTTNLTISSVTTNNNMDLIVVVSNGHGSVTSAPPANLTVAGLIYSESFNMPTSPDQSVNHVGWMNDVTGSYFNRIFSNNHGVTYPRCAVYSYNSTGVIEAFYGTSTTITGGPYSASPNPVTNRMAFPGINLSAAQNVSFTVAMNTPSGSTSESGFICVQMNFGPWYVSTNAMQPSGGLAYVTNSTKFYPDMSAWNQLTVSGTGSDSTSLVPVVGSAATNNLTGYITGVGLVVTHSGGSTLQFDNYTVLGAIPPNPLPVFSGLPQPATNYTGTTQTFAAVATSNGVASAVTYQWMSRPASGGTFVNLTNGGQYSGVHSSTLVISNVTTSANHREYAVIATDGAGSVQSELQPSAVPAILTVVDSQPLLINGTTAIQPNNANLFLSTLSVTNEAGNNNTLIFSASFTGTQPISYQWLVSPNPDGTGAVPIPGATSTTYTLSNPQVSDTGYYTLQASNHFSGVNLTNSAWIQLVILPASTATIQWSAPVVINGLTAAQILSPYGAYFEATSFGAGSIVTVTNGSTVFTFDNTSANATLTSITRAITGAYTGPSTGDTNFDAVLGTDDEVYGGSTLTLNNLISGNYYTVQVFGLNDIAGASRQGNYSIPTDPADVSASFSFGDNVYVVGTFKATATTQVITPGIGGGGAYVACVIVRNIAPSPTITQSGSNLVVTWPGGTLLQAPAITGPWTTNHSSSPLTVAPTAPTMFYRTQVP
jgi:hypothetical protein